MAAGRSLLVAALAGGALVALAFALNPSAKQHREAIQRETAERSPVAGALGLGHLAAFIADYRSYGVASSTTVNGKTVSLGALGIVYVLDSRP